MRNLEVKCGTHKHFQLKKRSFTFKNTYYQAEKKKKMKKEKKKSAVNRIRIYAYDGDDLIVKTH